MLRIQLLKCTCDLQIMFDTLILIILVLVAAIVSGFCNLLPDRLFPFSTHKEAEFFSEPPLGPQKRINLRRYNGYHVRKTAYTHSLPSGAGRIKQNVELIINVGQDYHEEDEAAASGPHFGGAPYRTCLAVKLNFIRL